MENTDIDFIQNDDGTTNLTRSFNQIMNEFSDLNKIPNYRPDLKAAEAQRLANKSICLTGELITRFEHIEAEIMRERKAMAKITAQTIH